MKNRNILSVVLLFGLLILFQGNKADAATPLKIVDAEQVIYLDGMDKISIQGDKVQSVVYSSSDKKVAKIDNKGRVTPLKKGKTRIEAKVVYQTEGQNKTGTLSYQLQVLGKSTEYFVYGREKQTDDVFSIYGLTQKGRKLKNVYIPGYYRGNEVSCVHSETFKNDTVLERVYTSSNLRYLDYQKGEREGSFQNFEGCINLREIHLGKSIVGAGVHRNLSRLEKITVDSRNKNYQVRDNVLFEGEKRLVCYPSAREDTEYTISETVSSIEQYAFSGAKNLKKVTIPEGVYHYDLAFSGCENLEKAVVETKADAYGSFEGCKKLKTVILPKILAGNNFSGCKSLERFQFTSDVKNVTVKNDVVFSKDGKKLLLYPAGKKTSVYTLPVETQEIEAQAFSGVQYLSHVRMNKGLKKIGAEAFLGAKLTGVTLNQGLKEIAFEAFSGSDLTGVQIPDTVKSLGGLVFEKCKKLRSVKLPAKMKTLELWNFDDCSRLTKLSIPRGVQRVTTTLEGCRNLAAITVDKRNPYFIGIKGVLYSKSKKTLYIYSPNKKGKKFIVPKSVKVIKDRAFIDNRHLKEVIMKDRVSYLGRSTFANAEILKKVRLSKKLKRIANNAFADCGKLQKMIIPDAVKEIESCAFKGCRNLRKVIIPDKIKKIQSGAFEDCRKLENVVVPDSVIKMGYSVFYGCTALKSVVIGRKVKNIRPYTFSDCVRLKKIVFRGKRLSFGGEIDGWDVERDIVFENTGSRNGKKLVVKLPGCNKKEGKKLKKGLYTYGLSKKAKIIFGK